MNVSLSPSSFDLVLCVGVLAYVRDVSALLNRVALLLEKNSILILECTDANHTLSRLDRAYQFITRLVKPRKFETYQHTSKEVLLAASKEGFVHERTFAYAYKMPLFSRVASSRSNYQAIRHIFGDIDNNKAAYLGNQCIFSLRKL
jgi:2-polyprenyl-3-methyl-5-hydroxy-6-metoxy-1,4-benzoquinol methylase